MCFMKKDHVLDEQGLGRSYSVIGNELSVNESTVILSKVFLSRKYVKCGCILIC